MGYTKSQAFYIKTNGKWTRVLMQPLEKPESVVQSPPTAEDGLVVHKALLCQSLVCRWFTEFEIFRLDGRKQMSSLVVLFL